MKRLLLLVTALLALGVSPAHADARVDVTNDRGTRQADLDYRTALTVHGNGFQVVTGGFGGVYVLFGWVDDPRGGTWKPSRGGLTGQDYQYVPDAEDAADNQGYVQFVAFPGSSTADEAQATLAANGSFTVHLTVPGPTFQSVDRDGQVAEVDCTKVTCGVITIGAHGVKNARNETFTPVTFGHVYDVAPTSPPTSPPTSAAPTQTATSAPAAPVVAPTDAAPTSSVPTTSATTSATGVTVDRTTAIAGHALAFTGRGFAPGEQVVAVLDDGQAALGPLTVGAAGDVAGVLSLPLDLATGTHALRLTGAASGTETSENFPVRAAAPTDEVTAPVAATVEQSSGAGTAYVVVAALLLAVAVVGSVLVRRRRRTTP